MTSSLRFIGSWLHLADAGEGSSVGTFTASLSGTPLPAALPLFATGIGAMGLLGWRRKRGLPTSPFDNRAPLPSVGSCSFAVFV